MGEVPGSIPGWAQIFLCTSEYFQRSFLINIRCFSTYTIE